MLESELNNVFSRLKKAEPAYKSILFFYFCLLLMGLYLHFMRIDWPYREKRAFFHEQIYTNEALAPAQYRYLPVLITGKLKQYINIPIIWGYWGQRFLFSILAVFAFHYYLRKWFPTQWTVLGVISLLAILPFTYLYYGIQPADPIVFFCYVTGLILIEEKRDNWLILLLLLGMMAKEIVGLLAAIYFCTRFEFKWDRKFFIYCIIYALVILGVYFGIRQYFGPRARYISAFTLPKNLRDLHTLTILPVFFSSFLLGLFYLRKVPEFLKRALLIVPFFILIHLFFGLMKEARLFVPLLPLIIPVGLFYMQDHWSY